jgi:hypothetical protein
VENVFRRGKLLNFFHPADDNFIFRLNQKRDCYIACRFFPGPDHFAWQKFAAFAAQPLRCSVRFSFLSLTKKLHIVLWRVEGGHDEITIDNVFST